jgi:CO/xanthine dehydrogenase FAD-binding subunit
MGGSLAELGQRAEVDINTVTGFVPADTAAWRAGDAWLGGGTWLFSQPQPGVRRLLDLTAFGWRPLTENADGLEIAATCTLAELARWRPRENWPAAALARQCCDALLGSFKVHNTATVGGNICLSLPAGPMIALAAALDGTATLRAPDGATRQVPVARFVTGDGRNVLAPGELLRAIVLPAAALRARTAFRQVSLSPVGRSAVLVIARRSPGQLARHGQSVVTITAATPRPVQLRFASPPVPDDAVAALDAAVPARAYLDDVHGARAWRAAMTRLSVAAVTAELAAP